MREAMLEADAAAETGEVPIGAVVVYKDEIIARAHNMRVQMRDGAAHAEMLAMRGAAQVIGDWRLDGCTLYVTLEPCPMCAGAIAMSRVDEVVFGAFDRKMGCCGSVRNIPQDASLGFRAKVAGGVLAEECAAKISAFMKKLRSGEVKGTRY